MRINVYRHLVLHAIDCVESLVNENDDVDAFFSLKRQITHLRAETERGIIDPFVAAKRLVSLTKKILKRKINQKPYKYAPKGENIIKIGGNMDNLGKRIKIFRIKSGMKQTDLAKKINVSSNYISIIENGRKEPSMRFMRQLAETLKTPMDLFFLPLSQDIGFSNPESIDRYEKLLSLLELIFSSRIKATQQKKKHATKAQPKNA